MTSKYRKLTMAAAVAALALGLAACGGSSNTPADPTPVEPPPPPPTDLETTQGAAAAAATAAKTASDAAGMASSDAMAAVAGLATLQTNAMAQMYADAAADAAATAMAEYMKAKAASEAAAAAELASVAGAAKADAEAAQMEAEAAAEMAAENAMKAMEAADMELMIDGTMKSVGDTSIDAMAGASSVSTGSGDDAMTVVTGLIKSMNPMATGAAITGQAFAAGTADDLSTADDESTADTPYRQAAAARTFAIGKVLDSSDDMARLMLVTDYAGTNMVNVFALRGTGDGVTSTFDSGPAATRPSDSRDEIFVGNGPDGGPQTADDVYAPLREVGMFYRVGPNFANLDIGADLDTLDAADVLAANTKPEQVYSYTHQGTVRYVVLRETETTISPGRTRTLITHWHVDITAPAAADGPDAGTAPDQSQISASIPGPVAYKHLHFGVWAALGEAAANGDQDVAGLGIGFVQSLDTGDGMTGADMPSTGSARYDGNWVATVQSADAHGGSTSLEHGVAALTANFDKATVEADLAGLAMLEGAISGSGFSGTKASGIAHSDLISGTFEGSFSGGFYGSKAAEAGGIFDFASDGGGAFRGAFGGNKTDD